MIGRPSLFPPFFVAMGDTFLLLVQYQHGCSRFMFPLSRPISTSTSFVSMLLGFVLFCFLFAFSSLHFLIYTFTPFFYFGNHFESRHALLLSCPGFSLLFHGLTSLLLGWPIFSGGSSTRVYRVQSPFPPVSGSVWRAERKVLSRLLFFFLCPKATCVTRTIPNHSAQMEKESIYSKLRVL